MPDLARELSTLRQLVLIKLAMEVDGDTWMRIERFSAVSGVPEATVREYRKKGVWPDGVITAVRGGKIYVNFPAYNRWVPTGRVAA